MSQLTITELKRFLTGLGQDSSSPCGPQPATSIAERATCCPSVGWVVYDTSESSIGICERAAGGGGSSGSDSDASLSPSDRVLELERRLEERRAALEEKEFQSALETARIKAMVRSVDAAEAARTAERVARLKAEEARTRAKSQEKLAKAALIGGGIWAAGKALKLF